MNAPLSPPCLKIAHRGYHLYHVENTLESFSAAYELGCDGVEFDVQLSLDQIPMIFHDDDLARLGHRSEAMSLFTADELESMTLKDPVTANTGHIPRLGNFLMEYGSKPFYLEIKIPEREKQNPDYWQLLARLVIHSLASVSLHPNTFVASFHLDVVRFILKDIGFQKVVAIHENLNSLNSALKAASDDPLSLRLYDSISMPVFQEANHLGWGLKPERILLWQVESYADFQEARDRGVAGVVADDVPTLLEVF